MTIATRTTAPRSYAARCADEYETATTTALRAVTDAGTPLEGAHATVALISALLTIGERLNDGQEKIAEALSDVGTILESMRGDRAQQSTDLADAIDNLTIELTGEVAMLASYVRAGLPWTTRLRLAWRARRWAARHPLTDVMAAADSLTETTDWVAVAQLPELAETGRTDAR